ncbi:MAG: phosphate starvation-inducible protein PhoH, partial [Lachnospiraceae bacterium]|nr:phosphate starvation-inducible protein PhoH [Lachnospiraceae bacterium]
MSDAELMLDIPTDHQSNIFGQFDRNIKKIEQVLSVQVTARGDGLKVSGPKKEVNACKDILLELYELSKRGNEITEQNVNYAISLKESIQN